MFNDNRSLSLESRRLTMELELKRLQNRVNQPVEQLDLSEQEKEERTKRNRIYEIERKEEVYGLGILIMEILMGIDYTLSYLFRISMNGECKEFVVTIPDELKKDEIIADIVEDCLLNVESRPTIQRILRRLDRWVNTNTPAEKQVEYNIKIV